MGWGLWAEDSYHPDKSLPSQLIMLRSLCFSFSRKVGHSHVMPLDVREGLGLLQWSIRIQRSRVYINIYQINYIIFSYYHIHF